MDFIGDLFALAFLVCLASAAGAGLAFTVWLLTRGRGPGHKRLVLLGASLPLASLAYAFIFEIAFGLFVPAAHETFPGDIDEPLPGGYSLKGLDKMPEYSFITRSPDFTGQVQVPSNIASIAVEGQLVLGSFRTRQPWDTLPLPSGFFAFNTATSTEMLFANKAELDSFAGHSVSLIETSRFSSREPKVKLLRRLGLVGDVFLPILALVVLGMKILAYRRANKPLAQALQ